MSFRTHQVGWGTKVKQNSCFSSKIKQRNSAVKNTANLKKKKKKSADMNSLLFIILLRNMFRASYSQQY